MRVSPLANAATTASTGYSSIMEGARSGGTVDARQRGRAGADVGDRLAALLAPIEKGDVGAHLDAASV